MQSPIVLMLGSALRVPPNHLPQTCQKVSLNDARRDKNKPHQGAKECARRRKQQIGIAGRVV